MQRVLFWAVVLLGLLVILGDEIQQGLLVVIGLVGVLWIMIRGIRWQRRHDRRNNQH